MFEGNHCRNWRRLAKESDELPGSQLTKLTEPGFVGFVSSDESKSRCFCPIPIERDHIDWKEDFHHWTLVRCTYKGRCFGGIEQLYADFCDWCFHFSDVPCTRSEFLDLLSDDGYYIANGMVSGVVLRDDLPISRGAGKSRRALDTPRPS